MGNMMAESIFTQNLSQFWSNLRSECQKLPFSLEMTSKTWYFAHVSYMKEEMSQLTFICSKWTIKTLERGVKFVQLTIKTPELRQLHRSGVFIFKFEHILHLFLSF